MRRRAAEWILTFRQSCLSWCCHLWSPCCPAESLGSSSPRQCRSQCSAGWYSEASSSHRLRSTGRSIHFPIYWSEIIQEKKGSVEEKAKQWPYCKKKVQVWHFHVLPLTLNSPWVCMQNNKLLLKLNTNIIICFWNYEVNIVECKCNMWFQDIEEYHLRYIDI